MKRALVAAAATTVGVVALLEFKTRPAPQLGISTASALPPASPQPTPTTSPTTPASPTPAQNGTFTGPDEQNQFGDVQVQVQVSGGKVTLVKALKLPNDRARSAAISQYVAPILSQEAVQAQSANIDGISGATYTSYSYALSLQAALAQAGIQG